MHPGGAVLQRACVGRVLTGCIRKFFACDGMRLSGRSGAALQKSGTSFAEVATEAHRLPGDVETLSGREMIMNVEENHASVNAADYMADVDIERQEYLDETHLESSQFGVGRWTDEFGRLLW